MTEMTIARRSWRTPAIVILFGCLIGVITFGVRGGFGLFLSPISESLGWGREVFALSLAIQNIFWGLGQPAAGMIADKYGAGRVLAGGGLLYAAGVFLMAYSTTPLEMHLTAGLMVGLGVSAASFTVVLAAISRVVSEERRSLALGVGTAAGSLGQFIMVPAGQVFLAEYGWQTALILLSLFALLIVPLSTAFAGRGDYAGPGDRQTLREALKEAGTYPSYLFLTAGFFVCGFHVMFIATHLPAYITDAGLPQEVGAWALALVGLFNIAGSFLAGLLGGKYSKKYLLSSLYMARAVAIAIFVLVPISSTTVLVFAAVMGLLWLSTVPLTSGLVAQMFGLKYMASLFGIVFFSHQVGSFLGIWLGGYLYDNTGSYEMVWWISVALGVISSVLHWPIREAAVPRLAKAAA